METSKGLLADGGGARKPLRPFRAFIIDLDGCVYRGEEPVGSVAATLRAMRRKGKRILFLTNNTSQTREEYVAKLKRIGVEVKPSEVLTSALATAHYLEERFGATKVLVVGEDALRRELERAGHKTYAAEDVIAGRASVHCVVAGIDFGFNYQKLKAANLAIRSGARFIATNLDSTLPTESGLDPGAGAIVSAISTASSASPEVVGKPSRYILDLAVRVLNVPARSTVVVGDRLETDIAAGNAVGAFTVLVLSGATTEAEALTLSDGRVRPKLLISDINQILAYM